MKRKKEVDNLDQLQKLQVYMHYYIKTYNLLLTTTFYFEIDTFEKFIASNNIVFTNNGKAWKIKGFAQEIRTEYYGIYNYYWKFKSEIKLI